MRKKIWRRECVEGVWRRVYEEGSMVFGRKFVGEILRKGVWKRECKE